jgi:hypothetical protein
MTQVDITSVDNGNSTRYQTPTFDPRCAFARTLRSGEIALLQLRQRQNEPAEPTEQESWQTDTVKQTAPPARRYETPTFHPRSMFARTLRSGEIALLERRQRLAVSAA